MTRHPPSDPARLQDQLFRAGVLARGGEYLVQPIAGNPGRADADLRRSFLVWEKSEVLFHVTVGRGLRALHRRHVGFSEQYPEITCHPLFLVQQDGMDIAGREYFPGRNLEEAFRTGVVDAATTAIIVDDLQFQLAAEERKSTPMVALRELTAFGAELLALKAWSEVDRLFLRAIALPWLEENFGDGPFRRRWSNGDFIARNIIVGIGNKVRLIDYEFATRTHFFGDERLRFSGHSHVPDEVKRGARALRLPPSRFEIVYSLLNHARLSERVLSSELARSEITAVAARIAELVAAGKRHRTYFLAPAARPVDTQTSAASAPAAKFYWGESGSFTEASAVALSYPPGRVVELAMDLPAGSQVRHLRIDPAERAGLVHLVALRLRSLTTMELLREFSDARAMDAIQIGGTALRLPADEGLLLLSTGEDPWLVLPPLERVVVEPVRLEIRLRFDGATIALESAAAAIATLTEKLRQQPGEPRLAPVLRAKRKSVASLSRRRPRRR